MSKKTNAAILIIGNEILSGRTQDTNTSTLSLWLNSIGVKVQEVRVIPDIEKIIIDNLTINLLNSPNQKPNWVLEKNIVKKAYEIAVKIKEIKRIVITSDSKKILNLVSDNNKNFKSKIVKIFITS